ncbi:MAG: DNA methyltransferase [Nitrososphaerales archaeon]
MSDLDFDINGYPMNCKKFACKLINLSDKHANMESLTSIGKYIKERYPWMRVSLENPDVTVLYIVTNSGSLVGIVDYNSHRLKQSARSRPYFHPVALEPRLSRVMINLTMCKENDLLLDPFCGTGSILLDAAAMNIRTIGCDISEKMCYGALANAGMNSAIVNCDALSLPLQLKFVDGIATDLPYGRAASTMKRSAKKLLEDFVSLVSEMKGKRCCVMCRKGDEQLFDNIVEQYDIYEHRNLTRNLMVLCS